MNVVRNISHPILSQPIEIPKKQNEQYSIKSNCFDPSQSSPPSIWKTRLNKRLGDSPIKHQYK